MNTQKQARLDSSRTRQAILYIVATPIGNLEDITLRALRILKEVDLIACEDTRQTRKLLSHFEIKTGTVSYHQHSKVQKLDYLIELLRQGKNVAMVSDSGTPGISDPGNVLVKSVAEQLGDSVQIMPIPGACAAISLASVSGLPTDKFLFLGFPPHKKGREKFFKRVADSEETVIFYESPHRFLKALNSLSELLSEDRKVVVGRELTKVFEEVVRGAVGEVLAYFEEKGVKGEFVVVAEGKEKK